MREARSRVALPETGSAECARRISRRRLLRIGGAVVAGAALPGVAGCGGGAGQDADGGGSASEVKIEHDAGSTTVEAPAKSVAAISDETVDLLAALGVEPVALASSRVSGTPGEPIGDSYYVDIGEPVYLGQVESPSIERLAGLGPDLVVMDPYGATDLYEKVSEVAPTLSYGDRAPGWWRRPLVDVGRATGREARGRRFVADYDARVKQLREKAAPMVDSSPKMAVLYAPDASTTFVFDERGAPADPFAKLGFDLVVPEGVRVPEEGFAQVSLEVAGDLRVETIVVLRPTEDETPKRLPLDDILDALEEAEGGPRVVRQVIDPTRPSSSPIADKQAIEQAAELLLGGR